MPTNIRIESVAHGGHGVCRIDGQVCFVPYALPGDVIDVAIVRQAKRVLWGRVERVVEPSPDRIEPDCPVFGECGGCSWLHFAYPAQAEWKRRIVSDCFARIGGIDVTPEWSDEPSLRHGYRTRAEFHGDGRRCGRPCGFYRAGSRDVVDIADCPLCHPKLNAALDQLRTLSLKASVELVVNPESDEVLAWTKRLQRGLRNRFPLTNTPRGNSRHFFLFDGVPIVNGAFSQSSLLLNRLLRRTVNEAVAAALRAPGPEHAHGEDVPAASPPRILDLYCGNGNLSLDRRSTARVTGLDHSRAAIAAANARPNASSPSGADVSARDPYRVGDEADFKNALRAQPWDVILLDPPRTGAKAIATDLAQADARSIIYVSCDPATLARDVRTLAAHGWHVQSVTAVDLFPHTPHVETVCRLSR